MRFDYTYTGLLQLRRTYLHVRVVVTKQLMKLTSTCWMQERCMVQWCVESAKSLAVSTLQRSSQMLRQMQWNKRKRVMYTHVALNCFHKITILHQLSSYALASLVRAPLRGLIMQQHMFISQMHATTVEKLMLTSSWMTRTSKNLSNSLLRYVPSAGNAVMLAKRRKPEHPTIWLPVLNELNLIEVNYSRCIGHWYEFCISLFYFV